MSLDKFHEIEPYSLSKDKKEEILFSELKELTQKHYESCPQYKNILDMQSIKPSEITKKENIPYIPVRLFKEYELKSVQDDEIFKTMTSSGTSGQAVSKIFFK